MPRFQCLLGILPVALCVCPILAGDAKALRATYRSQIIQSRRADLDDLSRMRDTKMVKRFARLGLLDLVPKRTKHDYVPYTSASYRYLRPWTKLLLTRLSQQHHARFKKRLKGTSLIRTIAYQNRLRNRNGNAASATGPQASLHLTGATLDSSKAGMTAKHIAWMRRVLASLTQKGYIYAVEELRQPLFHIMVYKNYPTYVKKLEAARTRRSS